MCGIAGFIDPSVSRSEEKFCELIKAMSGTLYHRGPDAEGIWVDIGAGVALGHRRLSIQDLAETGRQPMHSRDGRYIIIFNGEIYNFQTIREELSGRGASFRGRSDTEVLIEGISEWGLENMLNRVHGMFAFALWDKKDSCLKLVRDRMGEKPLYYGFSGPRFFFASELKAMRKCPWWSPSISREVLQLYFRFNYIPDPFCIYENIKKLDPGCLLTFHAGKNKEVLIERYWTVPDLTEHQNTWDGLDPLELAGKLNNLLRNVIQKQLVADVPVGCFLSGGVDSSLISAVAQEVCGGTLKTFTVGFREKKFDESPYARKVAETLRTDHTEVMLGEEDALALIPKLSTIYDEPFADSSQLPTILVAKTARKHVTVALGGDGGDELLAGYPRYFAMLPKLQRQRLTIALAIMKSYGLDTVWKLSNSLLTKIVRKIKHKSYDAMLVRRKMGSASEISNDRDPQNMYLRYVSFWPDCVNPAGPVSSQMLSGFVKNEEWSSDFLKEMMVQDTGTYLPGDILTKLDRATMSVSLESRLPFLDHEIVEFCMNIPGKIHMRDGRGKWLARSALRKYLPDYLIDRPKAGFAAPIDEWLRGPLKDWAETNFDRATIEADGYLNAEVVENEWGWHKKGLIDRGHALWGIAMFQCWLRSQETT